MHKLTLSTILEMLEKDDAELAEMDTVKDKTSDVQAFIKMLIAKG